MSSIACSDIPITLKPMARARRMRLRVDPRTGGVVLTYPRRMAERRALAWAAEQHGWIEAAIAGVPAPLPLAPGAEIPFRGAPHRIVWDERAPRRPVAQDGCIVLGGPAEMVEVRLLRWLKAEALRLLEAETRGFAARAGVVVPRVGVGDPVSRWGSCAWSGGIRYSWRLILAPDFVRRATAAHEVAHRIHMHHGPEFHTLVAEILGADPAPARAWLKRHGAGLHRVAR